MELFQDYSQEKLHGCGSGQVYRLYKNEYSIIKKVLNNQDPEVPNEIKYTLWASENNIGPQIHYYDENNLTLYIAYLQTVTTIDAELLFTSLRKMHDLTNYTDSKDERSFQIFEKEYNLAEKNMGIPECFKLVKEKVYTIRDYLRKTQKYKCICHNDLHLGNILKDGENIKFIDWTFAGVDYPIIDFVQTIVLSQSDPLLAVTHYYKNELNEEIINDFHKIQCLPYALRSVFPLIYVKNYNKNDIDKLWISKDILDSSYYLGLLNAGNLRLDTDEELISFSLSLLKTFNEMYVL